MYATWSGSGGGVGVVLSRRRSISSKSSRRESRRDLSRPEEEFVFTKLIFVRVFDQSGYYVLTGPSGEVG